MSCVKYRNHDAIIAEIEILLKRERIYKITSRKIYWAAQEHPDLSPILSAMSRKDGTSAIGICLGNEGWHDISDSSAASRTRIWERPGCKVMV